MRARIYPDGNMSSRAGKTPTWSADNSLASMVGPDNVTEGYGYDTAGQRVIRQRLIPLPNGVTTVYVGGVWEEDAPGGTTRSLYQFNGKPIAQRAVVSGMATLTYLHGDHLGSVSASSISAGALQGQQRYKPFGETRQSVAMPTKIGFTGQYRDDTGLMYYGARYYDQVLARFISADSIVPGNTSGKGGAAGTFGQDGKAALRSLAVDFHEPGGRVSHRPGERLHAGEGLRFPTRQ